mgnify:FL=1
MNRFSASLLLCVIAAAFAGCSKAENGTPGIPQKPAASEEFRIVPKPQFISYRDNQIELKSDLTIGYEGSLSVEAEQLKEALTSDHKMSPSVKSSADGADILLALNTSMDVKGKGGYKIEIAAKQIKITAPETIGIFYGIQTLRQAIKAESGKFSIREATISDYPTSPWRSLMLDEGRYFKGKDAVKKLLYEMARLKYNYFHWHLTEDQGWRLEIKKYPKLIEIGSKRPKTGKHYYWISNEFYNEPHEGHYTQADVKEIIEFAEKLHITIIPEIEILTHASAAIASYSYLGTTGKQIEVECRLGPTDEIMDISKPETMQFIHDVLDEVADLFSGKYIHCGGDEIQGNHWINSAGIRAMKNQLGIKEDWELERHFYNEISKYLEGKGKALMAWSDAAGKPGAASIIPIKVGKESVFQYWTGDMTNLTFLINNGLNVLYSHTDGLYFNTTLPVAYRVKIVPESIDLSKRKQLLGIGVECWSEFDRTVDETFDHMFPLIAVYADTGWMKESEKDYQDFTRRMYPLYKIWKDRDIYVGGTEETR